MKIPRIVAMLVLAAAGLLMMATAAHADPGEDIYRQVKSHIESMHDYTLQYDYHGPRGDYRFDYRCIRPLDVRTQIIQGSNQGAVLVYRPEDRRDKVKAKKGIFTIWKDVNDSAIKGTPMVASVFDMALEATAGAHPVLRGTQLVSGHECYVLDFNNGNEWCVDRVSKDILKWIQPEGPNQKAERLFYNIQVNTGAKITL